jgi:hypothetical protein
MSRFNKCVSEIIQASGDRLSKREAAELLRKFNKVAKDVDISTRAEALRDILDNAALNMVNRNTIAATHAKHVGLLEEMSHDNMFKSTLARLEDIRTGVTKRKGATPTEPKKPVNKLVTQAFNSLWYGDPKNKNGLVHKWEAARSVFHVALAGELEQRNLLDHWRDKDTLTSAVEIVWDPSAKPHSAEAQEIASVLKGVQRLSVRKLNTAGSYVTDTPRVLMNSRVADPAKVRTMGKANFVKFVKSLDLDTDAISGLEELDLDEYLNTVYENMARGGQYKAPTGAFDGIGGLTKSRFQNLAANNSLDYEIPFANGKAFFEFYKALSDEPLQSYLTRRTDQIGRAVGLMNAFGPTPERTIERVLKSLEPYMDEGDKSFLLGLTADESGKTRLDKAKDLGKMPIDLINHIFHDAKPSDALAYMDGSTSAPVSLAGARTGASIRGLATMSSLANGVFMQLTDLPIKVAQLFTLGRNPMQGLIAPIEALGKAFPDHEQKMFYARLGLGADQMRHALTHELGQVGYTPNLISRTMDWYFKLNLMGPFDLLQKRQSADFISSELAWGLKNPNMKSGTVERFKAYGFTEDELIVLRDQIVDFKGVEVVSPERIAEFDDELYSKYLGTVHNIITELTPTPGVREKAITLKGTRPGTPEGELWRTAMMFKNYPIMLMSRVYPTIKYEHGMSGMLSMMTSMFLMWYIGDSLKALSQGKTPRDMTITENVILGMTRSGLGGLYSDFILADYHKHGMNFTTSLFGPVAGKADDLAALGSAAFAGEATPNMAVNTAKRLVPNIHIGQTLLDKTLMYGIMESLDPGITQRSERRLQEKTGQQRIF